MVDLRIHGVMNVLRTDEAQVVVITIQHWVMGDLPPLARADTGDGWGSGGSGAGRGGDPSTSGGRRDDRGWEIEEVGRARIVTNFVGKFEE